MLLVVCDFYEKRPRSAVRFVDYKRKLNYIYTCSVQPNRLVPTVTRKILNQVPAGIL